MEPDFTGYATRSGLKCADGRTIMSHAFQGNDGQTVPLVWQHRHDAPENVLGYVILHSKEEGVRAEGFFNDTPPAKQAKALVQHGDIKNLSIYANGLVQQAMNVVHGIIREVSLVLSGANPGAFIDNVNIAHGDGVLALDDEAVIYTDEQITLMQTAAPSGNGDGNPAPKVPVATLQAPKPPLATAAAAITHAVDVTAAVPSAASPAKPATVEDVINSLSDQQREVVYALIGAAMQQSATTTDQPAATISNSDQPTTVTNDNQKGAQVSNVFDQSGGNNAAGTGTTTLTHSDLAAIFDDARRSGSLKNAVEDYALAHGITNIDLMFPDARAVTDTPDWQARRQEWVQGVLSGTRHTPFSRIKTMLADITLDEARARGYVKGAMKREEWFAVSKRVTTPQTIYKKQKLDRDDIIDISDFDVVAWLKTEMRLMLDEEVARAILIGDGRDVADPDKISETNVRPILTDSDVYTTTVNVITEDFNALGEDGIVDKVATAMQFYQGTGQPTFYAPRSWVTKMLLAKDTLGRRLHATLTELADAMGIGRIVPVDVMEATAASLIGIIVNLQDYTVGTDRGGEVNFFDDFDIDYNKYTYLYETRLSGALVKFKAALVVKLFTGTLLVDPAVPTFVKATGVVTIPAIAANTSYVTVNDSTGVESGALTTGAQSAITAGTQVHIRCKPAAGYAFPSNASCNWTFQRPAA
jgi:HK97 family phage prohead protease